MPKHEFDLIVIGSGPGGYVAALHAAQLGLKVACVEKSKTFGGTCLNVGCIPSKALLQSTEHYAFLRDSAKSLGIECGKLRLDFAQMMQRKEQIVKGLVEGIGGLFQRAGVIPIRGEARFVSPERIEVVSDDGSKRSVEADNFILATGSEPISFPFLPFNEQTILSSTGALNLSAIPKKLLVVGGGVIGVELASVYNRLGSEVVVIEMLEMICPAMDPAISKDLLQVLKKQGIPFLLGAKVLNGKINKASKSGSGGVVLQVSQGDKEQQVSGDAALIAIGRRPYTQGLNLTQIGVEMSLKGFVQVDSVFRTNLPHIYAIGDVIEGPMLAHRASDEGVAAVNTIAGNPSQINYMAIPNVIYTSPEAAALGLTEPEAKSMGLDIKIGISYLRANPRARCAGETSGLVKVVGAGPSKTLVGLHILGSHASEMIGEGVIAIEKRATLEEIARASHAHPSISESIKEACAHALIPS